MSTTQAPTEKVINRDRVEFEHPAFGQLQLTRVSGTMELYGSEFRHQHYIGIALSTSRVVRNLSNDWHHADKELFRIYMSEAQFASFITGVGVGGGTPCTIGHIQGQPVPEIERPKPKRATFEKEFHESISKALEGMETLGKQIEESKLPQKAKTEMLNTLRYQIMHLGSTTQFIANQFEEHMETVVERAKQEITGFVQHHPGLAGKVETNRIAE